MNNDYVEIDAAWFSGVWLLDHPDFPLATAQPSQPKEY